MSMKKINLSSTIFCLMVASVSVFALTACGGDDNGGSVTPTPTPSVENANANTATNAKRLEFPRLQDASGSNVYVIKDESTQEVNYSLEWNKSKKTQFWSCWEMYKGNMRKQGVNKYKPGDSKLNYLPWGPQTSDFIKGSGYDHGHICPSADRLNNEGQNKQTFYYCNMQPQIHAFNDGVWGEMENQVRDLVENYTTYTWTGNVDTLFVCRGGTIGTPTGTISDPVLELRSNGLVVPNYYFCALLKKINGVYEAIGLIFEHKTNSDTSITKYCVSIDELEKRTGFDFFCNLPDDVENKVEAKCNPASFGFK